MGQCVKEKIGVYAGKATNANTIQKLRQEAHGNGVASAHHVLRAHKSKPESYSTLLCSRVALAVGRQNELKLVYKW